MLFGAIYDLLIVAFVLIGGFAVVKWTILFATKGRDYTVKRIKEVLFPAKK